MNNVRCILAIATAMLVINLNAQSPGGVSGYTIWEKNNKTVSEIDEQSDTAVMNFRLPINFNNKDKVYLDGINNENTLYLVFKSDENKIYDALTHLYAGKKTKISNKAVKLLVGKSDKDSLRYVNGKIENGVILSMSQSIYSDLPKYGMLKLSKKLNGNNIAKKSNIMELIYYPRILDSISKIKLFSYFSLKYGISLAQKSDYANASGKVIWNHNANEGFNNYVTGLAADPNSGLITKQFKNTEDNSLEFWVGERKELNISNNSEMPREFYLITGNNGKELKFQYNADIQLDVLQKAWKIVNYRNYGDSIHPSLIVKEKKLFKNLPREGEKIWLLISDKSNFSDTNIVKIEGLVLNNDEVLFSNIDFLWNGSEFKYFTVATGSQLTLQVNTEFNCLNERGELEVKVRGAQLPYNLEIRNDAGVTISKNTYYNEANLFGITEGKMRILVSDKQGNSKQVYFRCYKGIECLDLSSDTLIQMAINGKIVLNPSEGLQRDKYTISWNDKGSIVNEDKLLVDKPGKYQLSICDNNGKCKIKNYFVTYGGDLGNDWQVYPNPASVNSGIWVDLNNNDSHVESILIFDASGGLLKECKSPEMQVFRIDYTFDVSGTYIIVLKYGDSYKSKTIIIQ